MPPSKAPARCVNGKGVSLVKGVGVGEGWGRGGVWGWSVDGMGMGWVRV